MKRTEIRHSQENPGNTQIPVGPSLYLLYGAEKEAQALEGKVIGLEGYDDLIRGG